MKIGKIDEKLSIFKNNKVVIWNTNEFSIKTMKLLKSFEIEIFAFCYDSVEENDLTIEDVPVISVEKLQEYVNNGFSITIQHGSYGDDYNTLEKKMFAIGINKCIAAQETWQVLRFLLRERLYEKHPNLLSEYKNYYYSDMAIKRAEVRDFAIERFGDPVIIICLPSKTGDHTLINTFDANNIPYYQSNHVIESIDINMLKSINSKIKIITAVREPISQNISVVYQGISRIFFSRSRMFKAIPNMRELMIKSFGNAQTIFDLWYECTQSEDFKDDLDICRDLQSFIPVFNSNIIDLMKEPFDIDRGFSVIKESNIEIFVYQLEKINDIKEDLSKFIGFSFNEYVIANVATDKWIGSAYRRAQDEIKFSQEYFDKCFNEPYVKHFYSNEDIEKFRSKWINNIK